MFYKFVWNQHYGKWVNTGRVVYGARPADTDEIHYLTV